MGADQGQFRDVFAELKAILEPYESDMVVKTDTEGEYYLNTRRFDKHKKPIFFAVVKTMKNYVSYHFMPVYFYPQLLDDMPEQLRKRMQGKACFNFAKIDKEALEQLAQLTARGVEHVREHGTPLG